MEPLSDSGPLLVQQPLTKAQLLFKTELLPKSDLQTGTIPRTNVEPPDNSGASSKAAFDFIVGSASEVEPFSANGSLFTKQAPLFTKKPLFGTQLLPKTELLFKSELFFNPNSPPETKLSFDARTRPKPTFNFGAQSPFKIVQSPNIIQPSIKERLVKTQPLFEADLCAKNEPPPRSDSIPRRLFDTSAFPKTQFVSKARPSFEH
jgi:hypothetical protein